MRSDTFGESPKKLGSQTHLALALAVGLVSMACLVGGTWANDSSNWRRAFGSDPPSGIVVVHSWYWRSSHWSLEYEYFFEIEATDEIAQSLVNSEGLQKLDNPENLDESLYFHQKPNWFAPKPLASYDVHMYAEETAGASGHFIVLVDRETGHIYISDYQV